MIYSGKQTNPSGFVCLLYFRGYDIMGLLNEIAEKLLKNFGKKELFESWGYTIEDSEYLQQLYVSQAIQKYCDGEYFYKGVEYYARI